MKRQIKDIPEELLQHIQSHLPVKDAACTSVLSKSWLHAWSTNRTLRFHFVRGKKSKKLVEYVDRTLKRYRRDNIPIEKFDLEINIKNRKSVSRAKKWIHAVATKTNCLKEFSLSTFLDRASYFMVPDELLLCEKLTKIRLDSLLDTSLWMTTSPHPMIKCVSLQELHLACVLISEEALNAILSSCSLLVEIELFMIYFPKGFKTIKVTNLACLYKLSICLNGWQSPAFEISDVPNLRVFRYDVSDLDPWEISTYLHEPPDPIPFNANVHSMSLRNVTQLMLGGVVRDNACLDLIKSGFPFLESLTLHLGSCWKLGSFHFTCTSIKRLTLALGLHKKLSDVEVYAPKLLSFSFVGNNMPNILCPVSSSLRKIELSLTLDLLEVPVDVSFFLKMREALTLSPKCDIHITFKISEEMPLDIDIDDLRRRLVFPPAMNVQQLDFGTFDDECMWERSPFFDAFFEICHPKHVFARPDWYIVDRHKNHFCRLMLRDVLEKKNTNAFWPHQLEDVLIRRLPHKNWKSLKSYRRRFLHGSAPVEFKLEWH